MALSIKIQQGDAPREARIRLAGDLDADGARIARRELSHLLEAGRVDVKVNLDRVGFLDSSGLASLIAALRQARDRGGDVRVETTNKRIRRILEVTALARVFKLEPVTGAAA